MNSALVLWSWLRAQSSSPGSFTPPTGGGEGGGDDNGGGDGDFRGTLRWGTDSLKWGDDYLKWE